MVTKKKIVLAFLICMLLLPLWMWLAWLFSPKKKMVAAIIDKTVLTAKGQEHASFTWLLNNHRFSKTSSGLYQTATDYFGFFPRENEQFELRGLERFSPDQLSSLSNDADLLYITDTYGIYKNEWYSGKGSAERSGMIYGGLSHQDMELLRLMKDKRKLILTEFNTIGSPTRDDIRKQFESLFGMRWTGWTARYFSSLDTSINTELPRWLITNYKREHQGNWPFHKAGLAFVNSSDRVVILEEGIHLTDPMPYIESNQTGQKKFNLPEQVKYPFWFDVIVPDKATNTIAATFKLHTSKKGEVELKRSGLPAEIPAVIYHMENDYRFCYFSGDFCDNNVSMTSSYFKGISLFSGMLYNSSNQEDRSAFFWKFYEPMMKKILLDYYNSDIRK